MKLLEHVRAALASDPDRRMLYWLCERCPARLPEEHVQLLRRLQAQCCADWKCDTWATEDERGIIRTLFRLWRGSLSEVRTFESGVSPDRVPARYRG